LPAADLLTGSHWVPGEADSTWRTLRRGQDTLALVGVLGAKGSAREALTALLRGACDQLELAFARIKLLDDLDRANWGALTALARAVDAKSPWTHGHSTRVAEIAAAVAAEVGLSAPEIERIRRGCLVHDVGKIGVPSAVLDKVIRLNDAEITTLRSHVEKGARILQPVAGLADILPIVWQHHERLDGSGYPRGLRGAEIDFAAGLVAVADVFEALTANRPYRVAWSGEEVEEYLGSLAGVQFDAGCVEALLRIRGRHRSWLPEA
jgi:putative nucleotidyltransferase with HDIG domain